MNSRLTRYLACFLIALGGTVSANNPFRATCSGGAKTCKSCSDLGLPPLPDGDTPPPGNYCDDNSDGTGVSITIIVESNESQADADAACSESLKSILEEIEDEGCGGSGEQSCRGVSPSNYQPTGLFSNNDSGAVTYTLDDGVRTPRQVSGKGFTLDITKTADGKGFQMAQYFNDLLPAKGADGLRAIPTNVVPYAKIVFRNPDGPATTSAGRLDVVKITPHRTGGQMITRTTRLNYPVGSNTWTREYFMGDPSLDANLVPYRKVTVNRIPQADGTEMMEEIIRDRYAASPDDSVITSHTTTHWAYYKTDEPVKLAETRHTGTGSDLTTYWTYYQNASDPASFNKPATLRRSDGQWANTTYQGNITTGILVTKTISGWLDNPAPAIGAAADENANRVVTEIEAFNETGTFGHEDRIQGVLVSKTWGERYKDNAGLFVTKDRMETGASTLTTIQTRYPNDASAGKADRGRLKSVQNPDGTVELHTHTFHGDNLVTTIDKGAGTLAGVTDGTRTASTSTNRGALIKNVESDIASGIVLSTRDVIGFDVNGGPNRWAYDNNPDDYSEMLLGCCSVDSRRTRDGITTTYTWDALKRPVTETSHGVTTTHTYGSRNIGGTAFPSVTITATAGTLSLNKGTTVYDHAGNVIQQISPDLDGDNTEEITTIAHDFAARSSTTTNPDGGTLISTDFADGQSKSTTGTATSPRFYSNTTHTHQGGGERSSTSLTATGPWTRTYQDLAGRTLKTTFDDGTTEVALQTNSFDSVGRVISTKDADNVTQLVAYNAKGEAYRRAIDLNQTGQIDNADRITDTLTDILEVQNFGPAIRTQTLVYDDTNTARFASTTLQSPDGLLTRTSSLGVAVPSSSLRASHTERADGSWTDTATAPDGTKTRVTYQNWLPVTQSRLDTANNVIESTTTGHDALLRTETRTHSRTASAVVTRTAYHATNGLVFSVTDDLTTGTDRVTSFAYDSMGRRTATTLPDNSVTHISYWPTGREKATWGSQTNPTVKLYSPQGKLTKLRTFRSINLALAPDESTGSYDETTWFYDDRDQLRRKEYADGKGTDYTYTSGGRLHTRIWARTVSGAQIVTTYGYSTAGELTTTDYSDTTPDVIIVPDKLGRQQSVTNGLAQSVFTYDPATLALDCETISYNLDGQPGFEFSRVLDRSRDSLGRDTGFLLKNGTTIENQAAYQYSATDGRISSISDPQLFNVSFTYAYVSGSNLIDTVTGPAHTVDNVWEADCDVLDIKENKVGSTPVSKYDYGVNQLGQRHTVGQSGSAFAAARGIAWCYDPLGQVTSADSSENAHDRGYLYDAIGNRRGIRNEAVGVLTNPDGTIIADQGTLEYASNALNQYTTANGSTLPQDAYDFDGNLKSGRLPANQTENSGLTWDAENRLVEVRIGTNGPLVRYAYDSQSRRIARSVGASTTIYLRDDWNVIAEYEGAGLAKTYIWGTDLSGVGGLLAIQTGSQVHYPTFDGNGNVSEYLDVNGAPAAHFEYDPFGNTVVNTDTTGQFAHRFSTKPVDPITGLLYYGYRYYDPVIGRWPTRDPIEEDGGINLYGFIDNEGLNNIDNLGMFKISHSKKTTRDLKPGAQSFPPYPGENPQVVIQNSIAITVLEYELTPTCKCIKPEGAMKKYYILEEYDLKVVSHIHLLPQYPSNETDANGVKMEDWVISNEDAHAKAHEDWTKDEIEIKIMKAIEAKYKVDTSANRFEDDPTCLSKNKQRFIDAPSFKASVKRAYYASSHLDDNRNHDWTHHKRHGVK